MVGDRGGGSGKRAEDLKGWHKDAKHKKEPEGIRWELVFRLVQVMFRDGTVPEEILWATMGLLPKGKGGYRGVELVEVLWKVYSVVVNCRLKRSVVLHNALHGFIEGMGIATLYDKQSQHLAGLAH